MIISNSILIMIAVLLLLAAVTPLFSPFSRRIRNIGSVGRNSSPSPVTILLTAGDSNASHFEDVIDAYLEQEYSTDYQVIVIIDTKDAVFEDVLKLRAAKYSNLYWTKIPDSSRYLSRKKLAITIGMRAAKYDFVILTNTDCIPTSSQWLQHFMAHTDDDTDMIIGLTPFEHTASSYWHFEQVRKELYLIRYAQTKGHRAICTNQSLVAMRKSDFFAKEGFTGNLQYQRGEFEFLVNKYAKANKVAYATDRSSRLTYITPSSDSWYYRKMHTLYSEKDIKGNNGLRLLICLDLIIGNIYNIATTVAVAFWCVRLTNTDLKSIEAAEYWIAIGTAILLWLISYITQILLAKRLLKHFNDVSLFFLPMRQYFIVLKDFALLIRYRLTDKYDFMTHRL